MATTLKPHDGISETFVCRDCMELIDPVGTDYEGYTKADCDAGRCPLCGGTDTAWLFAGEADEPEVVYVVRDVGGEYLSGKREGERTPASDEAREFETREEAEAACTRATDRVLEWERD